MATTNKCPPAPIPKGAIDIAPDGVRNLGDLTFNATLAPNGKLVIECNQQYVYIGPASGVGIDVAGEAVGLHVANHLRRVREEGPW